MTSGDPKVIFGDLDAHRCKDSKTWRGVIGRNRLPDLNPSGALLLDFCARHGAAITNTMFQHQVHMVNIFGDKEDSLSAIYKMAP